MSEDAEHGRLSDDLLEEIASYVLSPPPESREAVETARYVLMDSLGCAMLALRYPECSNHIGPIVPGTVVPNGARVPGTIVQLDPVQAAFNIGCLIRWLDYNDCWLAQEWGHPSDNLGAILALTDYTSRLRMASGEFPWTIADVLSFITKAHEIQGVLALDNSLNRVGLDHVLFVKVASTAVAAAILGGTREQVINALSHAWIDGASLRIYRHAPNTGSRKSWAAGDATSRAVWLALMALKGEMGYRTPLTVPVWGFQDVLYRGKEITLGRPLGSYVIENVLFKVSYPAEFHAQTALECAITLHPSVADRLDQIERIIIITQESAIRIIDKSGPLHNPADRDHCIQYITAIGLIYGDMTADHYGDEYASDPRIDALRAKMEVTESTGYSRDYLDPDKRSIANAVQVHFADGSMTGLIEIEYPIGHRRRREEATPLLRTKCSRNLQTRFSASKADEIMNLFEDESRLSNMPVNEFMDLFVI